MFHRKLSKALGEQRPIWVFLRDQQRWVEKALVVDLEGDLVTLRYDAEDEDELHSWEESVRIDSIGAISTRLAFFSRHALAEDLEVTGDCPESEQLPSQG